MTIPSSLSPPRQNVLVLLGHKRLAPLKGQQGSCRVSASASRFRRLAIECFSTRGPVLPAAGVAGCPSAGWWFPAALPFEQFWKQPAAGSRKCEQPVQVLGCSLSSGRSRMARGATRCFFASQLGRTQKSTLWPGSAWRSSSARK